MEAKHVKENGDARACMLGFKSQGVVLHITGNIHAGPPALDARRLIERQEGNNKKPLILQVHLK
jgi:hypothetical protein